MSHQSRFLKQFMLIFTILAATNCCFAASTSSKLFGSLGRLFWNPQRYQGMPLWKKTFHRGCKTVGNIIMVSPLIGKAIAYANRDKIMDAIIKEPASNIVQDFIHKELHNKGVNDAKDYSVYVCKYMPHNMAIMPTEKRIFIGEINANEIEQSIFPKNLINYSPYESEKTRNKHLFVVQHEANHALFNHIPKKVAASFVLPTATYAILNKAKYLTYPFRWLWRWVRNKPRTEIVESIQKPSIIKSVATVPGSFMKTFMGHQSVNFYGKKQEQEADDHVDNSKAILQGGIDYFEEHIAQEKNTVLEMALKQHPDFFEKPAFEQKNIMGYYAAFNKYFRIMSNTHPLHEDRLAKLKTRLHELKESEDNSL